MRPMEQEYASRIARLLDRQGEEELIAPLLREHAARTKAAQHARRRVLLRAAYDMVKVIRRMYEGERFAVALQCRDPLAQALAEWDKAAAKKEL